MGEMLMMKMLPILAAVDEAKKGGVDQASSTASGFSITNFFNNLSDNGLTWAYAIIGILGIVAIVAGAYMLVTGLISHGKKQTSWPIVILLLLVGGIMTFGGWSMFAAGITAGATTTVTEWAGSVIIPAFML